MEAHHGHILKLSNSEALEILKKETFGHLACSDNDHPYIIPIVYVLEGEYVYGHARHGKKLDIMRKNPHICLQVEKVKDFLNWRSVMASGDFEELKGDDAQKCLRLIELKLDTFLGEEKINGLETYFDVLFERATAFRFKIKNLSGRREGDF